MFIFFVVFATSLFAEDVAVKLSRNKVGMNESFSVEFILAGRLSEKPDFSPLEKDFDVLSQSSGFQTTIINGNFSETMSWNLVLMPKNEGELILPSIQFGKEQSLPQTIQVSKTESPKKEDPLYITAEIRTTGPFYEQMPLIYVVRLYSSHTSLHGALSELKLNDPDAIIKQFGPDNQYEVFDQTGKRRLVVERQYSVIPQHAGELIFYPVIFEGSTQTVPSFFNMQTNFTRIYSNQETADVKPMPASFQNSAWLPAYLVSLKEEWSKNLSALEVGDPVTWTITLTADGNFATQIPDIPLNTDKNLKIYPDKPELSNQVTATGFSGVKQIKFALIPQKAGEFVLPEIKVDWWDVKEEVKKQALLPARHVLVKGAQVEEEPVAIAKKPVSDFEKVLLEEKSIPSASSLIFFGMAAGCLIVCFIGFFFYRKWAVNPLRQARKALKKACLANHAKDAEYYLLYLMKKYEPGLKPVNLMSIKPLFSTDLQHAVDRLYCTLYGEEKNWDGRVLLKAFYSFKPKKKKSAKTEKSLALQELYPQ